VRAWERGLTALVPPLNAFVLRRTAVKVSVVTPVFNEIDNIAPLVATVVAALAPTPHEFELICVDGRLDRRHAPKTCRALKTESRLASSSCVATTAKPPP